MNQSKSYPKVLSIAGSDSSGGAGIQADLKTFSALGVYGATAITAITAQNTQGVNSQFALEPQMVYDQIAAVMDDIEPSVVKIGMLSNTAIVEAVAKALHDYRPSFIILDPVIVSSTGHRLLSIEAQETIKERLIPIADLLTPNIPEMKALTDSSLSSLEEKKEAAQQLFNLGAKAILLKGGHEEGEVKTDVLFLSHRVTETTSSVSLSMSASESLSMSVYSSETVVTNNTHGTGCTLSSAIAAFIARGLSLEDAISEAKNYVTEAIRAGADIKIGKGIGPVNHAFNPQKMIVL
ncbi:MAG: bifunctional hydroxymethylpyrimidine kinase/phosphomethylpyrimidine kinase [Bacteroidales bacterium]|nr:bifunctional hydroxymethylpyrimidine kinase/phosphomethylpyrimidine kinase [Bacteroidales bacterium]MBR3914590.1 bifunctional hydroxymethylpyrimidine kinase/phosphomethylpyrimidine kinase [Bacteroidales bacterium]